MGEHRFRAAEQLYTLYLNFQEWRRRNNQFSLQLYHLFPTRNFQIPARGTTTWAFFDDQFIFDLKMTLAGLSILCTKVPSINLRLITSDCVESYFSTIRACAGGGGQLNIKSHRFAARKASLVRLNLHSYIGEMIDRDQPVIHSILQDGQQHGTTPLPSPTLNTDFEAGQQTLEAREQSVVNYVAGWLLRSIMKFFPENQLLLSRLIQARVNGLYRCTHEFQELSQLLFRFCHQLFMKNQALLLSREDCHMLLTRYLLQSHRSSISTVLGDNAELSEFAAFQVSGLFLVDHVRTLKKSYQKSFRNGLSWILI